MDLVSVIIPTLHRPGLVRRAIASALAQTWPAIEVIVVIDGPDMPTVQLLASLADPRLTVLRNEQREGPGAARNRAAATARGAWLAFLDDDDEWLPEKLDRQLRGVPAETALVLSCRCLVRTPRATHLWPRRLPGLHEPVDSYLFGRRALRRGEAWLATPTLVLPAWLFAKCCFGATHQHEDTTLLLRATRLHGAAIVMRPEALVIIHAEEPRISLGTDFAWREGFDWLLAHATLATRHGISGFCLVTLGAQAARARDWRAVPVLLRHAWRHGAPTVVQCVLFLAFWAVPRGARRALRDVCARRAPEPVTP